MKGRCYGDPGFSGRLFPENRMDGWILPTSPQLGRVRAMKIPFSALTLTFHYFEYLGTYYRSLP